MLDNFKSDDPDDYIAGCQSHPHRGFETITYMITGLPLCEPITQYGPFVMNSQQEITQAVIDFQEDSFGEGA